MAKKRISKEVESQIYELHDQGLSQHAISRKLGISQSAVYRYVKSYKKELKEAEEFLENMYSEKEKTSIVDDKRNLEEEKLEIKEKQLSEIDLKDNDDNLVNVEEVMKRILADKDIEKIVRVQSDRIMYLEDKLDKIQNTKPYNNKSEEKFYKIALSGFELYQAKNKDYGNAFTKSYEEFGATMSAIRLQDKLMRFKSLIKADSVVKEESIIDTLIDLSNYAIMTIIEMIKDGE